VCCPQGKSLSSRTNFQVLVIVLVLESQVLDNNTEHSRYNKSLVSAMLPDTTLATSHYEPNMAVNFYHISALSLCCFNTNLLSVPRVHTTFASRGFSIAAPLSMELTPVWHLRLHSVVFLKPIVSTRPSVPLGDPHKCLRFGSWQTLYTLKPLHTLKDFL